MKWCVHTNSRLKGKKGPPARGAAPKGLGGVEPEKQPLRFADANHLPLQGRQGNSFISPQTNAHKKKICEII